MASIQFSNVGSVTLGAGGRRIDIA